MSDSVKMPAVGLGTYKTKDKEVVNNVINEALKLGYRHFDTAFIYENEELIGSALKESNISRKELFITSKIWNDVKTYGEAIEAIEESLKKLQVKYIDLILIHWPKGKVRDQEVYRAMEDMLEQGKVKAIGVSNFMIHHLNDLLETANIVPMMNQVELHPYLQQWPLQEYCKEQGIAMTAYGQFAKSEVFEDEVLKEIAVKHNVSISQVVIRWGNQRQIFMIPKTENVERLKTNIDVKDFSLDKDDMMKIRKLNKAKRYYSSPDNIDF